MKEAKKSNGNITSPEEQPLQNEVKPATGYSIQTNPAELLDTCKEWVDDTTRSKNYLNSLMLYRRHVARLAAIAQTKLSFEQIKSSWNNLDKVERNGFKKVAD